MNHARMILPQWDGLRIAWLFASLLLLSSMVAGAQEDASAAAGRLKSAFDHRSTSGLGSILPSRGRINVDLPSLNPAPRGLLSASQFTYLLDDLFNRHPVASLTLEEVAVSPQTGDAVVLARLELKSASGRYDLLNIRMVLADEEAGWMLREFRQRRRPPS